MPSSLSRTRRLRPLVRALALTIAACLAPSVQAAPQPPSAVELMDWAQAHLAGFFPGRAPTTRGDGFVFRGPYASGNFIGVAGDHQVYALGPDTGGQLLALGTLDALACVVHPASCQPSDGPALLQDYLGRLGQLLARGIASSADVQNLLDGCYLHEGYRRAAQLVRIDSEPAVLATLRRSNGATLRAGQVLDERWAINPDGSSRRELDVRYEKVFVDGMVATVQQTLVQGSTAGLPGPLGSCATPQVSPRPRLLGNQRLVGAHLTAVSSVADHHRLADGTPLAAHARQYRSQVHLALSDPNGVATYATLHGPGLPGGAKLVAPRLLRTAPEFAGRPGHFIDWHDADAFQACRSGAAGDAPAPAAQADCTTHGALGQAWGAMGSDPAAVDTAFARQGFVAGASYTLQIHGDDGWKRANGQAAATPLATYRLRLERLPASAQALAAGAASAYPVLAGAAPEPGPLARALRSRTPASVAIEERTPPRTEGMPISWSSARVRLQGRTAGAGSAHAYPASRLETLQVLPVSAHRLSLELPAAPPGMAWLDHAELVLVHDSLDGLALQQRMVFE